MIERSDGYEAVVYEYHGPGATSDIVSRVKKHHSRKKETEYRHLTGRKIAQGGRKRQTTVVVVVEAVRN